MHAAGVARTGLGNGFCAAAAGIAPGTAGPGMRGGTVAVGLVGASRSQHDAQSR